MKHLCFLHHISALSGLYSVFKGGRLVWITFDAVKPSAREPQQQSSMHLLMRPRRLDRTVFLFCLFIYFLYFEDQLIRWIVIGSRHSFLCCLWFLRECKLDLVASAHGFKGSFFREGNLVHQKLSTRMANQKSQSTCGRCVKIRTGWTAWSYVFPLALNSAGRS